MSEPSVPESEPIDAEFEPAPASETKGSAESGLGQPGWMALAGASVTAAVLGGLVGLSGGTNAPSDGLEDELQTFSETSEAQIAALKADNESLRRDLTTLTAATGDDEALETLQAELASLSEQIASRPPPVDLDPLRERLDALERLDSAEAVSPRQMNRAVSVLAERVDEIEAADEDFERALQLRADALAGLTRQIEALEARLAEVETRPGGIEPPVQSDTDDGSTRTELPEDSEQEQPSTLEPEIDIAEAAAQYLAASVALGDIETKARRGEAFRSEFATLEDNIDPSIDLSVLRRLAPIGAPTAEDLKAELDTVQASLEASETQNDGWNWFRRAFGDAVKIRRVDEETLSLETTLDAARDALGQGEVSNALDHINAIEGEPAAGFAAWKASAADRVALDEALAGVAQSLRESRP